jgi:hypothetical protein
MFHSYFFNFAIENAITEDQENRVGWELNY